MRKHARTPRLARLALPGAILVVIGLCLYSLGLVVSLLRMPLLIGRRVEDIVGPIIWWSGLPTSIGAVLITLELALLLPRKRQHERRLEPIEPNPTSVTVALMAYNDEESIGLAVRDFLRHPLVSRVIVVDNNSRDGTAEVATRAGADVVIEKLPGYGQCAYRCWTELSKQNTDYVVLCEGDMTFRARDIEKLVTFAPHADIVNGTRIVEQLRGYRTQLSTFMYYGNFFVGKLLEIKHIGCGTFTDVGTTYKLLRREILPDLLTKLNPGVNLEFNAHFMDRALSAGYLVVECPVTFHSRVGVSKGGNVSNLRALKVGMRMVVGLLFDWKSTPTADLQMARSAEASDT
jgi:hypothetical protein